MKYPKTISEVLLFRRLILMTLLLLFTSEGKRLRRNEGKVNCIWPNSPELKFEGSLYNLRFCFSNVAAAGKGQQESRIHGGKEPPEGKYPSLARIEYWKTFYNETGWYPWGVATIINRDWILTSAAIFTRRHHEIYNISKIRVIVGDSSINKTEPYEQIVYIERFIIHEKFLGGV